MASAYGQHLDINFDTVMMGILALLAWQGGKAGPWVLAIGLARYAFVAAGWVWPWLNAELPFSQRRRVICVVQIAVAAGMPDAAHGPAGEQPCGGSGTWSFAFLLRGRYALAGEGRRRQADMISHGTPDAGLHHDIHLKAHGTLPDTARKEQMTSPSLAKLQDDLSQPLDQTALRSVDRAICELRRGDPVVVEDMEGGIALALSVEAVSAQALNRIKVMAGASARACGDQAARRRHRAWKPRGAGAEAGAQCRTDGGGHPRSGGPDAARPDPVPKTP